MRHTRFGAVAVERYVPLDYLPTRAFAIASLLALLTAAEAAASGKIERDSILSSRDKSAAASGATNIPGPESDSSSSPSSAAAFSLYSEAYWTAVADLDLDALSRVARNRPELEFARGMGLLAMGDERSAERAFSEVSSGIADFNVAIASQMMLAHTLLYERKWAILRDLPANPALGSEDKRNTEEMERWGRAFANIEPQAITFPLNPVSLRLRLTAAGTPAIRVKINGKEYEFWLDTGSGITVLSSEVAAAAGVPTISGDSLTVRTFAGTARARAGLVRKIDIGPIVLTNTPAIIMDASMMSLESPAGSSIRANYHVDGIIGWDFIRQFDVVLNYERGTIRLARPQTLANRPGGQNLMWMGQPLVEVRTKDGRTLHLALDTGAQSTLLNAAVLDKVGSTTRQTNTHVFGLARTSSSTERVIPELALNLAGKIVQLQNVIVYGPRYSGLIACDGILGSDVSQFGTMRIDATNGIFSVGV
jgi:clan AA aspartic protease (TIGR02281 family)